MDLSYLIGIGITLLLTGFFAGIETAFISANKLSIELKKKQGLSSGRILSKFLESPARFTGTTLVALSTLVVIYTLLVHHWLSPLWKSGPDLIQNPYLRLILESLASGLVLLLVYYAFKALFRAKKEYLLPFFARVLKFFYGLLYPIAAFFIYISEWILKYLFDVRTTENKEIFSLIDADNFIQQREQADESNPQELNKELFENALSLPNMRIRQCLVPRREVEGIEKSLPIDAVRQKFIDTKLSKLIVYDGNIDTIQGYIHQLDLFKNPKELTDVLLPIPAVPETMSVVDLINKFTLERKSIAWVVDEFGGTSGIVTMEDLLEEIFGEIEDEYDTEEFIDKQIAEDEYIFSGRLELDYLREKYNLDFPETESETLSGFIINEYETIPKPKERIIIGHYEFDVIQVSDTRIEMVKLKILK
jgi:CBS domain containing-hemolysin-like protein